MTAHMLQSYAATLNALMAHTSDKLRLSVDALSTGEGLPPDIADRASMESGRNFALLMRERDRQALEAIREALARIDAGEYGICEDCGEDIAPARLAAQPMATLCVHCQGLREEDRRPSVEAASGFFQI